MSRTTGRFVNRVDDVLITEELARRPARAPGYEAENRAMRMLAEGMTSNPGGVLQMLSKLVLDLCRADSAGVSILEPNGEEFRWHAAAGAFAPYLNGTIARQASPCGVVVSRNQTLLFNDAGRYFPALRAIDLPVYENLLVPWHVNGEPAGTLWAVAHKADRRFDAEDARLLQGLSQFASAAYQMATTLAAVKTSRDHLERGVEDRARELSEAYREISSHETRELLLLRLLRAQRETIDADEMMQSAAETVGEYLKVDRVGFFEMLDDDTVLFTVGWVGGKLPPLTGTFPATGIGTRYLAEVRLGHTLSIEDASTDPLTADSVFGAIGTVSLIGAPIIRFGRWHAGLYVNHSVKREWKAEEVKFVREVADQTWDAVERTRAQRALGMSEEQLRLAIESAGLATWYWDPARRVVAGDEQMRKFFGASDLERPSDEWMEAIHEEDRGRVRMEFAAAIDGTRPYDTEYRLVTPEGIRWMRATACMINRKGMPPRLIGICEDVTIRKRTESALRQAEKLAVVGRLASSIAHEINNPLESVTNLVYLAQATDDLLESRNYLRMAVQELRRAAAITNQTLRFRKQSTLPAAVSSEELFGSTLAIYQGRLRNSQVTVEQRTRTGRPIVCHEGEIRQVLSNLISNAIDAIGPDGGRLMLRSRAGTDWKTGCACLALTVADTGRGISAETLSKIFEPFFTTKGIAGTGLGLWISQEIVERHQGRLAIRSSPRKPCAGTVFTIYLPFEPSGR